MTRQRQHQKLPADLVIVQSTTALDACHNSLIYFIMSSKQETPPRPRQPRTTYQSRRRPFASVSNTSSSACPSSDTIVVACSSNPASTPPSSPPPPSKRSRNRRQPVTTKSSEKKDLATDRKVQTHLSLSNKPQRKTCLQCGMSYDTLAPDDMRLHSRFHARAIGGVDVTIPRHCTAVATAGLQQQHGPARSLSQKGSIYKFAVRDLSGSTALRSVKTAVDATLRLCNSELSAPDERLAALAHRTDATVFVCVAGRFADENKSPDASSSGAQVVVGLCLVERAEAGFFMSVDTGRVLPRTHERLIMGISRIYTVHSARRTGVARALLDAARRNFVYGLEVTKDHVGWSQPSESGSKVAMRWCSVPMTDDEVREDRGDKAGEDVQGEMNIHRKIRVYVERA
ncbi:ESCO1/2 acetyl-transferase-domain-containing protein [Lipomyces orientalis]|uniref:ESCO1/2 acetyl-transferase-domain-containing protein n=1 Tax=Lipomyces orientalis TaxID=1233043 RepID=A0ACC3TT43_9ASCO